jgi:biotin carboxyl carrier protein
MPAMVLDVLVAPGDEVAEGQGLCVVEAMKMENLMRAPRGGVVKEIKTEKGRGVSLGDVLVVIE